MRIVMANPTRLPDVAADIPRASWGREPVVLRALYHILTHASSAMASMATNENHPMLRCPLGSTINAASSGPMEEPVFPPTENSDCASPCRPPEAMRAMRDASGWNTADPTPTRATANKIAENPGAIESRIKPAALDAMLIGIA